MVPSSNLRPSMSPNWLIGNQTSVVCSAHPSINMDKNSASKSTKPSLCAVGIASKTSLYRNS